MRPLGAKIANIYATPERSGWRIEADILAALHSLQAGNGAASRDIFFVRGSGI